MLTLNDGRTELWQWDTGRTLAVDADCSQVHFSNKVFGRSIDVDVVDGVATIPDILLQTDKDLNAWAFVGTAENGYTKISKAFKVNRRNKPADYAFTPHDQTTLGEIVQRLEELEAMQDPDAIRDAVYEYLAKNPIKVEETDPTVPDWAKQPEPPKVDIPEINIPTTLPNPHPLHFTGAVEASYDGSEKVTVEIPQGGYTVEKEWKLLDTIEIDTEGVRTVTINADKDGTPVSVQEILIRGKCSNPQSKIVDATLYCCGEAVIGKMPIIKSSGYFAPFEIHARIVNGFVYAVCMYSDYASSTPVFNTNVGYNCSGFAGTNGKFISNTPCVKADTISSIRFELSGSADTFALQSKIDIWGR